MMVMVFGEDGGGEDDGDGDGEDDGEGDGDMIQKDGRQIPSIWLPSLGQLDIGYLHDQ